jgi:hypothetical protein
MQEELQPAERLDPTASCQKAEAAAGQRGPSKMGMSDALNLQPAQAGRDGEEIGVGSEMEDGSQVVAGDRSEQHFLERELKAGLNDDGLYGAVMKCVMIYLNVLFGTNIDRECSAWKRQGRHLSQYLARGTSWRLVFCAFSPADRKSGDRPHGSVGPWEIYMP